MATVIFYWRDIVKDLFQAFIEEPLIGILLNFNQVRHLQNFLLP